MFLARLYQVYIDAVRAHLIMFACAGRSPRALGTCWMSMDGNNGYNGEQRTHIVQALSSNQLPETGYICHLCIWSTVNAIPGQWYSGVSHQVIERCMVTAAVLVLLYASNLMCSWMYNTFLCITHFISCHTCIYKLLCYHPIRRTYVWYIAGVCCFGFWMLDCG